MDIIDALIETEKVLTGIKIPVEFSRDIGNPICIAISYLRDIQKAIKDAREQAETKSDSVETEEVIDDGRNADSE